MSKIFPLAFLAILVAIQFGHSVFGQKPEKKTDEEKRIHAKKIVEQTNKKSGGQWKAAYNERIALMDEEGRKRMAGGLVKKQRGPAPPATGRKAPGGGEIKGNGVGGEIKGNATGAEGQSRRRRRQTPSCTDQVEFDARTEWSSCAPIIGIIADQSQCGSCWAVAVASAYTDRMCIQRAWAGLSTPVSSASSHFSGLDVLSCAPGGGCRGGDPGEAWDWIKSTGVVTGTDFTWKSGCKPYPFTPALTSEPATPACAGACTNTAWTKTYSADKKFASYVSYFMGPGNIANVEEEIRNYGSVVAGMDVYEDFYYYSSGIYKQTSTVLISPHAIRLIGWGTRTCSDGTSTPYWLGVNSWGADWGQQGLFQIAKGQDEVGIDTQGFWFGDPTP